MSDLLGSLLAAMKIRPLGAKVLVRPLPLDEVSAGGIILPERARDSSKEHARVGDVVGVGDGYRFLFTNQIALDVQVGDRVLYGNFVGDEIVIDGVKHQLIHEESILGVFET